MRYATWQVNFNDNPTEGTTPESAVNTGTLEGFEYIAPFTILGHVSDDADLSGLTKWNVKEVTATEALRLAKIVNSSTSLDENGALVKPDTLLNLAP